MSLIDEIDIQRRHFGTRCRVGLLRDKDPALYAEIVEAREAGCFYTEIGLLLRAKGIDASDQSLSRHFRQTCKCPS